MGFQATPNNTDKEDGNDSEEHNVGKYTKYTFQSSFHEWGRLGLILYSQYFHPVWIHNLMITMTRRANAMKSSWKIWREIGRSTHT